MNKPTELPSTRLRQPTHAAVLPAAGELVALDDRELELVCGGEVGQIAQWVRHEEFGVDPPGLAVRWSSRVANELYDSDANNGFSGYRSYDSGSGGGGGGGGGGYQAQAPFMVW